MTDKAFIVRKGLGVNTVSPSVTVHIASNDAVLIPIGNTGQRPTAANGLFRYNSETNGFEGYANGAWGSVGGSAGAGYFKGNRGASADANGASDIFRVHANTLTADVTINNGENALCAGPLTINTSITLTVSTGGYVTIV